MYFWIRLIAYLLTMWRRKPLEPPFGVSRLTFRAWPTDIDASMHMNNGRYSVLADIGRFDLLVRMGLGKFVFRERLAPVLMFSSVRYRREIRNFQSFAVETRLLAWSEKEIYAEHKFILTGGKFSGQVSAVMYVKAGLYDRKKRSFVSINEMMNVLGITANSPPVPEIIEALIKSDELIRQVTLNENDKSTV